MKEKVKVKEKKQKNENEMAKSEERNFFERVIQKEHPNEREDVGEQEGNPNPRRFF